MSQGLLMALVYCSLVLLGIQAVVVMWNIFLLLASSEASFSLLLRGDISLNPGPVSLGVINYRSVRNKGPTIADTLSFHLLDTLAITETHTIHWHWQFAHSITQSGYKLCKRPHDHGRGRGVSSFVNHNIQFKIVDCPESFENIWKHCNYHWRSSFCDNWCLLGTWFMLWCFLWWTVQHIWVLSSVAQISSNM